MAKNGQSLRFAALIRVSTEKQATKGESLSTQKSHANEDVHRLGGRVVEWYGGQEHATPGYERKAMERLLRDAAKGKFDAVWVDHPDRWSRDNAQSKSGLQVLRKRGISFFVRAQEFDLHNPLHNFFLGVSAEIGELVAGTQNQKSIENRIERAIKGLPTAGRIPFGRVRIKEKWEVDPNAKQMMEDVARRYLAGESLAKIAKEYGVNHSNLHKNLTRRCGDEWEIKFKVDNLNVEQVVKFRVPRLLPERTINAIRERIAANKTYLRSQPKHKYLLGRLVFCSHCGYAMSGQNNHPGTSPKQYYRHPHASRSKPCPCQNKKWVVADELEQNVIRHLLDMVASPRHVQRAIAAAIPNKNRVAELKRHLKSVQASIKLTNRHNDRVVAAVAAGTLSKAEVEREMARLRTKKARHEDELRRIRDELENVPDADEVKAAAKLTSGKLVAIKESATDFHSMSWDDKRALIELVLGGRTPDGKRCGVYIEWLPDKDKSVKWRYSIRGTINLEKLVPLDTTTLEDLFNDPDCTEWNRGVRQCASH